MGDGSPFVVGLWLILSVMRDLLNGFIPHRVTDVMCELKKEE